MQLPPILMPQQSENARLHPAGTAWWRRALIGLWVLIFVLGGGALALNWDSLMTRLSRPPLEGSAAGMAQR